MCPISENNPIRYVVGGGGTRILVGVGIPMHASDWINSCQTWFIYVYLSTYMCSNIYVGIVLRVIIIGWSSNCIRSGWEMGAKSVLPKYFYEAQELIPKFPLYQCVQTRLVLRIWVLLIKSWEQFLHSYFTYESKSPWMVQIYWSLVMVCDHWYWFTWWTWFHHTTSATVGTCKWVSKRGGELSHVQYLTTYWLVSYHVYNT